MTEDQTRASPSPPRDLAASRQRFQASLHGFVCYVRSPGVSVRAVWEECRVSDEGDAAFIRDAISWPSFRSTSSKESWTRKRREHWAEVRRCIVVELLERAVAQEIENVAALETMKVVVLASINGDEAAGIRRAKARSMEGALRAFMALDRRVGEKRRWVKAEVQAEADEGTCADPGGAVPSAEHQEDDGFSDAEVLVMAEALAELRALG